MTAHILRREMFSLLHKSEFSLIMQNRVMQLVDKAIHLSNHPDTDDSCPDSADDIMFNFTQATGISLYKLRKRGNNRELVDARFVCAYLIRRSTSLGVVSIGKMINRHYSTVLHGVQEVITRLRNGDERITLYYNQYVEYVNKLREEQTVKQVTS